MTKLNKLSSKIIRIPFNKKNFLLDTEMHSQHLMHGSLEDVANMHFLHFHKKTEEEI